MHNEDLEIQYSYMDLFENFKAPILLINPDNGKILKANNESIKYYGYKKNEMLKMKISDISVLEKKQIFNEMKSAKLQKKNFFLFNHKLASGEIRNVELHSIPVEVDDKILLYTIIHDITDRKLQESYFEPLFRNTHEAIAILDNESNIINVNTNFIKLFGYELNEIRNRKIIDIICIKSPGCKICSLVGSDNNGFFRKETKKINKHGQKLDINLTTVPIINHGKQIGMYIIMSDITENKQNKSELEIFKRVLENNTEGVIITDKNGIIEWVNFAFSLITEFDKEEIIGKRPDILLSKNNKDDFINKTLENLDDTGKWSGEIWNRKKGGHTYPVYANIFVIKDDDNKISNYTMIFKDITETKMKEEKIQYLAFIDNLTGLYNRQYFMDKLKYEIQISIGKNEKIAILYFDIDGFKKINDTLGHSIGDKLLYAFSKKVKEYTRNIDTIARIGGDEFVILLSKLKNDAKINNIANRIISIFEEPFFIDNHKIYMSASIGISVYPDDSSNAEDLIRNADIAMYRAKGNRNLRSKRYSNDMKKGIDEQFKLGNDLRNAISNNELHIYYQPIIDIKTNKIVCAEALLRWKHEKIGNIPPSKFIPIAENNGLIFSIGEWVLRNACKQNVIWQSKGYNPIVISVNISVRQLEYENFVEIVKNILDETGIDPKYLELEITESISMQNIKEIIQILSQIKELGVSLSIDDFGTGYSSFGQLKNLFINKLKIDKSFIQDINENINNTAIVSAIIAMAKNLDLKIVAEGIETSDQLEFLKNNNCNLGQGYLFSRPIDTNAFENLIN